MLRGLILALALATFLPSCGRVSGDLFLAFVSGQVVRGAGADVLLVRATGGFERVWGQAVADYKREIGEVITELQGISVMDDDRRRPISDRGFTIVRRYREWAEAAVAQSAIARVRADVNGSFQFPLVRSGRYYVVSQLQTPAAHYYWMVPVNVWVGASRVDLAQNNVGWPFHPIPAGIL